MSSTAVIFIPSPGKKQQKKVHFETLVLRETEIHMYAQPLQLRSMLHSFQYARQLKNNQPRVSKDNFARTIVRIGVTHSFMI